MLEAEVLDENTRAVDFYSRLGMETHRLLDCYDVPAFDKANYGGVEIVPTGWESIVPFSSSVRSWNPTWQNNDDSLMAIKGHLLCVQATDAAGLTGFAAMIPESQTLAQLAVRPDQRRKKLGSAMVARLQELATQKPLHVLNADAGDGSFSHFMTHLVARRTVGQRALRMQL
ncbi:MAG: GNAT family N-acetyltransferase [Alphaproteobacteria bacterium]|jgi:hypothetical protein|nr:GNAT family N-acetyltransferase [Rhodospirillaceae bacterium]MDG2483154.1 GNAT family N-acetyltransferase [Alphaproteobacteria bacterium]MBT6204262.1 GNAT family N-acetyltransferase [Rhodospirillaceae bacterium]MBT6509847.1 GNAT family N-acetyltransferase [Rhodospirillaceae bacterium]MBT7613549.1 GNAT family N-acetyltransferase [Rhodospirillaceae bacterium]